MSYETVEMSLAEFMKTVSTMELVQIQYSARGCGDELTLKAAMDELRVREKQISPAQSASEQHTSAGTGESREAELSSPEPK